MDRLWTLVQAACAAVLGCAGIYLTGYQAATAIAWAGGVGLGLSLIEVVWFVSKTPLAYYRSWSGQLASGSLAALIAFGPLLTVGAIVAHKGTLNGAWIESSQAAAFAAVCITIVPVAMTSSSLIDNYLVLPAILGLHGDALWSKPNEKENARLRRWAQFWIAHRGMSELIIFPVIAISLAIPIVAAGTIFGSDPTLPAVFESLGGAGVAFAVFGFARPRWKDAFDFALSAPVGIGYWVQGVDLQGSAFVGIIIDVSVSPGIKIITDAGNRIFIPLDRARSLSPAPRAALRSDAWAREQALTNLLKIDAVKALRWRGPPA